MRFYGRFGSGRVLWTAMAVGMGASAAASELGGFVGVSSSNVQAPARIYPQGSVHFGVETQFVDLTPALSFGVFWEANRLTALSGQAPPFDTGGDVSGLAHFFGVNLRFQVGPGSPVSMDLKLGANGRSIGAPPPPSDLAPGLGAAIGYRFAISPVLALSPRVGYRLLSYSVEGAAHYVQQGYDVNLLLVWSLPRT
jgi:hypothetical protein